VRVGPDPIGDCSLQRQILAVSKLAVPWCAATGAVIRTTTTKMNAAPGNLTFTQASLANGDKVDSAPSTVKLFPAVARLTLQRFRRQLRQLDPHAVEVGRIREARM
jgi:hypothetical protein